MIFNRFVVFCLWAPALALAVQFYGNSSTVRWRTAETPRFDIHYPAEYRAHAGEVAAMAEAVYDSVVGRYRTRLPGKVNLVMRNALYSNGLANPVYNTMNIWMTDWDLRTRSTHDWTRDVITHEFSHLVSIQSSAKLAPFIHGLQMGYGDFLNERITSDAAVFYPFSGAPSWFSEGTAQYESSRMGFDSWDTHRDMLVRMQFLSDDGPLPLWKMRDFTDNALEAELGPYTQGFSLTLYIARKYGDQAVPRIWSELSRVHRATLSAALQQVIGVSEKDLYREWKADRQAHYDSLKTAIGTLRTGTKRTTGAWYQDWPRVAGGRLWAVSNFGGADFDGGLFTAPLPLDTITGDGKPDSTGAIESAAFAETPFQVEKPWWEKGFAIWSKSGAPSRIAYSTWRHRDRMGRAHFDIVVQDSAAHRLFGKRPEHEVTRFADAVYPDFHPSGDSLVFVRREPDGVRFRIAKSAVDAAGEEPRDILVPSDTDKVFQLYTPRWSPDGHRIAFSLYDGRGRNIMVMDADGRNRRQVAGLPGMDARDPAWWNDSVLVFADDRTGIFNLYRVDLSSGKELRITNVLGGAFAPTPAGDTAIFYTGYDKDGFSLYELSVKDAVMDSALARRSVVAARISRQEPMDFTGNDRRYLPLPFQPALAPLLIVEERGGNLGRVDAGEPVAKAGFALSLTDPLQKNQVDLALLLALDELAAPVKDGGLNPRLQHDAQIRWENRSFPVTLGIDAVRRNIASRDTVRYEDPRSAGDSLAINDYAVVVQGYGAGAGYSVFKKGDTLAIGGGYSEAGFNLVDDGFAWTYYRSWNASLLMGWTGGNGQYGKVSGDGSGAALSVSAADNDLYRPGTFQESFVVDASGAIRPRYRKYQINEAAFAGHLDIANPIHPGAKFILGASGSGIVAWSGSGAGADTLDGFFQHAAMVAGYPVYADAENLMIGGDRVAQAEAHYLFPLWQNMALGWWILDLRGLWLDLGAQAGTAWDETQSPWSHMKIRHNWYRGVLCEIRLDGRTFATMPLAVSLRLERAIDDVPVAGGGLRELTPIALPLIPEVAEPTRIHFQVGYQFANTWEAVRTSESMR